MADSGSIRAGRAFVELFADREPLKKDLEGSKADLAAFGASVSTVGASTAVSGGIIAGAFKTAGNVATGAVSAIAATLEGAEEKLKSWGQSISGLGAVISAAGASIKGALSAALATFEEMGTSIKKLSDRTGAAVEDLSSLGFAATQSGSTVDALASAMEGVNRALEGTGDQAAEAQKALAQIGLSSAVLKGIDPASQFRTIAERLASIADPSQRAAAALKIFGSAGEGILPMLAKGTGSIAALESRARDLGLIMSTKDASAAEKLHRALAELWATVKMLSFAIGAPLADGMRELVETGTSIVSTAVKWVRENTALIQGANKLATVLTGVGAALIATGAIISGAGAAIGYFTATLAALLSPVALVTAAIAGAGYAFVKYTKTGGAALQWLMARFQELKTDAVSAFEGIANALSAGDVESALKVVWALIKLEWAQGVAFLQEKWLAFKDVAVDVAAQMAVGITNAFLSAVGHIKKAILEAQILWEAAKAMLNPNTTADQKKAIDGGLTTANRLGAAAIDAATGAQQKEAEAKIRGFREDIKGDIAAAGRAVGEDIPGLRKDFDDAVAHAKGMKKKPSPAGAPGNGKFSLTDAAGVNDSLAKISTSGTFSASAVRGLGGGPLDNIANNTAQSAKYLKQLVNKASPTIGFS